MSGSVLHLLGTLEAHNKRVTCLAMSADDTTLVSGSRDKSLVMWDLEQQEPEHPGMAQRSLLGHFHFVEDVVLTKDDRFALSASWDSTLRMWDLESGECRQTFTGHSGDVTCVDICEEEAEGKVIYKVISGGRDKKVILWNVEGKVVSEKPAHEDWVTAVKHTSIPEKEGEFVITASWDRTLKYYQLPTEGNTLTEEVVIAKAPSFINCISVAPNGSLVAVGCKDGSVVIYSLPDNSVHCEFNVGAEVNSLEFSPMKYWIAVGTTNGMRIVDIDNAKQPLYDSAHHEFAYNDEGVSVQIPVHAIRFSHDGHRLFAGGDDGRVFVFDTNMDTN
ncbi:hypothetical protein KIPB_002802 [Kipferlia bialata]|uniref:RSE1/DDB1/CPSF1 second beta-propeller domain-containing protein n=1 Tax=Kipferlia bialata TaxID=797122 RepID=A0A391P0Z4_9EUKA|nr:hypothetical protein KIPB_002802 [Kipferlia bialata]|eukprot:g2802.t1